MATGVFPRPYSGIPQSGFRPDSDILAKEPSFSCLSSAGNLVSGKILPLRSRYCYVPVPPRWFSWRCSISDEGNFPYYGSPRCGGKKKEKSSEAAAVMDKKKKKKVIKGLSKKLLQFSEIGYGAESGEGLISEVRGKIISVRFSL